LLFIIQRYKFLKENKIFFKKLDKQNIINYVYKKIMSKVKNGDTVSVHYTGKLDDGTVFDSSLNEGREPLTAKLGQNQLIKGFENALIDMSVGEKKTIKIESYNAYGPVVKEMVVEVPKSNLPEGVTVGQMLQAHTPQGPVNVKVVELTEDLAVLDGNHPLAGKDLTFDLEVLEIM
jgi:FKBP-type peptidyl-prolyl cis-trans isomerase SlpA